MKKIYALLLTAIMAFSLTACNTADENENSVYTPPLISTTESETSMSSSSTDHVSQSTSTAESTDNTSSSATESEKTEQSSETPSESSMPVSVESSSLQQSAATGSTTTTASTAETKPANEPASTPTSTPASTTPDPIPEPETTKVLVAYFSATNTTEGVAERIADVLDADLYEITPETPYTSADLDYHSDSSRSTIEMNDPNSRPAISDSVDDMEQYDIVFVGYPIWWGEAPRILSTFVESYDFSGKTVVPFCTSGGSGVGSSARNLERLTSGANWLDGTRLNGSASENEIVQWINGLGLDITAE